VFYLNRYWVTVFSHGKDKIYGWFKEYNESQGAQPDTLGVLGSTENGAWKITPRLLQEIQLRQQRGQCNPARLPADCGYDADWIRAFVTKRGAWANIPPKRNRKDPICFSPYLYRDRNLVERFFNKIKQCRRIATQYDKLAANYLAFVKLACIRHGCAFMSPRPRSLGTD
jgi:transposase